jgi:hypothetical protein
VLEKRYSPGDIEKKWYDFWIENGYFKAEAKSDKPPYCIVIPPPNGYKEVKKSVYRNCKDFWSSLHFKNYLSITYASNIIASCR